MPRFASIVVNALSRFALARDIERYPEFMPDVVDPRDGAQRQEPGERVGRARLQFHRDEVVRDDVWDEEILHPHAAPDRGF